MLSARTAGLYFLLSVVPVPPRRASEELPHSKRFQQNLIKKNARKSTNYFLNYTALSFLNVHFVCVVGMCSTGWMQRGETCQQPRSVCFLCVLSAPLDHVCRREQSSVSPTQTYSCSSGLTSLKKIKEAPKPLSVSEPCHLADLLVLRSKPASKTAASPSHRIRLLQYHQ